MRSSPIIIDKKYLCQSVLRYQCVTPSCFPASFGKPTTKYRHWRRKLSSSFLVQLSFMTALSTFLGILLTKGNTLYGFLFAVWVKKPFQKWDYSQGKVFS